jgi:hypothetical protein
MTTSEENRNLNVPSPVDESVVKPGYGDCGDKQDCEKKELDDLQAADPGNQGA